MSDRSYLLGLIGAGVGPSLSPPLHMAEARALGLNYIYRTIDIVALGFAPPQIAELVTAAKVMGFDAVNITHPGKRLVVPHLDRLDEQAARLGAVNTVVFDHGAAVGYNTDVSGFATAFRTGLPGARTAKVVQLGAGGAGAAVGDALLGQGIGHLTIVDIDAIARWTRRCSRRPAALDAALCTVVIWRSIRRLTRSGWSLASYRIPSGCFGISSAWSRQKCLETGDAPTAWPGWDSTGRRLGRSRSLTS